MFSEKESSPVDYHYGTTNGYAGLHPPLSLKDRKANTLMLASYMTVRSNCEELCSNDVLNGLPEDEKSFYRSNSHFGQSTKKEIINSTSKALDGCIRRCFGKFINFDS